MRCHETTCLAQAHHGPLSLRNDGPRAPSRALPALDPPGNVHRLVCGSFCRVRQRMCVLRWGSARNRRVPIRSMSATGCCPSSAVSSSQQFSKLCSPSTARGWTVASRLRSRAWRGPRARCLQRVFTEKPPRVKGDASGVQTLFEERRENCGGPSYRTRRREAAFSEPSVIRGRPRVVTEGCRDSAPGHVVGFSSPTERCRARRSRHSTI
jgi:hypothetical protein